MVRTRKIFASVAGTTNDAAHIDVLRGGVIRGVDWTISVTGAPATGDYLEAELSFASTSQITTNDANGIISMCAVAGALTTSGAVLANPGKFSGPMGIPIKAGERIYLNCVEAGANTYRINVVIQIDE